MHSCVARENLFGGDINSATFVFPAHAQISVIFVLFPVAGESPITGEAQATIQKKCLFASFLFSCELSLSSCHARVIHLRYTML
jgi:hypothetical protein